MEGWEETLRMFSAALVHPAKQRLVEGLAPTQAERAHDEEPSDVHRHDGQANTGIPASARGK